MGPDSVPNLLAPMTRATPIPTYVNGKAFLAQPMSPSPHVPYSPGSDTSSEVSAFFGDMDASSQSTVNDFDPNHQDSVSFNNHDMGEVIDFVDFVLFPPDFTQREQTMPDMDDTYVRELEGRASAAFLPNFSEIFLPTNYAQQQQQQLPVATSINKQSNTPMMFSSSSSIRAPLQQPPQPPSINMLQPLPVPSSAAPSTATASFHMPVDANGGAHMPPKRVEGAVVITEEPAQFGRFRYKSEKREKCLEGEKTFPEVMINSEVLKNASNITINVSLTTRSGQPHWHELAGTTRVVVNPRQCRHKFSNLSVLMDKGAGAEMNRNKDDQRAVRLRFDLTYTWNTNGQTYISTVLSQPVFNAKLQINKLSHTYGSASGGNEIIILCSKIRKTTTAIRVRDVDSLHTAAAATMSVPNGSKMARSTSRWERVGAEPSSCTVPSNDLGFHHQFAVMVTMPAYHNVDITESVRVELQIVDTEDGTESQPVEYVYVPNESTLRQERTEQKRRRVQDEIDEYSSSGNDATGGGQQRGSSSSSSSSSNGNGVGGQSGEYNGGRQHSVFSDITTMETGSETPEQMVDLLRARLAKFELYAKELEEQRHVPPAVSATDNRLVRFFASTDDVGYLLHGLQRTVNIPDDEGDLPLHIAISNKREAASSKLIEIMGATELNRLNKNRETALHMAVATRQHELARKLIRYGARLNATDCMGRTPFHLAACSEDADMMRALTSFEPNFYSPPLSELLQMSDFEGFTALHYAVSLKCSMVVTHLLQLMPSLAHVTDKKGGRSALNLAAYANNMPLCMLILESSCGHSSAKEVLTVGDNGGNSPLHHAVAHNNLDLVSYFLKMGAQPRQLNEYGESSFQIAFQSLSDAKPMLRLLANPIITTTTTPTFVAAPPKPIVMTSPAVANMETATASSSSSSSASAQLDSDWVVDDFNIVPAHEVVVHELDRSTISSSSINESISLSPFPRHLKSAVTGKPSISVTRATATIATSSGNKKPVSSSAKASSNKGSTTSKKVDSPKKTDSLAEKTRQLEIRNDDTPASPFSSAPKLEIVD